MLMLFAARYQTEIDQRAKVLVRHVACLRAFNGQEGARFADSLVNAVARSDRLAQELCLGEQVERAGMTKQS